MKVKKIFNDVKVMIHKKKSRMLYKWITIAACAALVLGIGLLIKGGRNDSHRLGIVKEVIYPKAYAFDDSDTRQEIRKQNPVEQSFLDAMKAFSYKTSSLILTDAGKNMNYSPVSLYYALALATSGARGDTQAELIELLGVADAETLTEQCGNLYRLLYCDNKIGKLKIANSIWMDDDFNGVPIEFKRDFVKQAAENFYASSYSVDFSGSKAGKAMADWISTNTNNTLSPTFEADPEQILSILNTVYFYDQWVDRFDKRKTAKDTFFLSDGSEVETDFMNQTYGSANFIKGEGFTRAGIGLKNNGRMVFILPEEGVSPYDLLSSPEKMRETFEGGEIHNGEVVWKIPKFSFESKLEVTDVLKSIGVSSAFADDADFTGITDHMAFITGVRQETHIAIDEIGVEASAFTQIMYAGAALPEGRADMILDRPFVYGITAQNGSLLFVGICENPAE